MPASGSLDPEVRALLCGRFGVAEEALRAWRFENRGEEIWASTVSSPPDLPVVRPLGVRALRRGPDGLRPTSALLVLLGRGIRSARVEIDDAPRIRRLLLGHETPCELPPGFVALSFRGDVLGCGEVRDARLRCLLPTGRRKDLLDLLEDPVV